MKKIILVFVLLITWTNLYAIDFDLSYYAVNQYPLGDLSEVELLTVGGGVQAEFPIEKFSQIIPYASLDIIYGVPNSEDVYHVGAANLSFGVKIPVTISDVLNVYLQSGSGLYIQLVNGSFSGQEDTKTYANMEFLSGFGAEYKLEAVTIDFFPHYILTFNSSVPNNYVGFRLGVKF